MRINQEVPGRVLALAIITLVCSAGFIFAAVSFLNSPENSEENTTTTPSDFRQNYSMPAVTTVNDIVDHAFAGYVPLDENYSVSASSYTIEPGLSNVQITSGLPALSAEQKQMIEENGFVVVPQSSYKQIYEILNDNYWPSIPSFVTSDSVLHTFHVLYDMSLRVAETWTFWDLVGNLTESLLNTSYDQFTLAPEGRWKGAALRNVMFFSVAMMLLDNETEIPSEVEESVAEVLDLIEQHQGVSSNWFMKQLEDFSQYVPRGHYTRSEILKRYFKAMMWYGRVTFRVMPDGVIPDETGMNETAQAILISLALKETISKLPNGTTGYHVWDAIYEPTTFFVGTADDLTPQEYLEVIEEIYDPKPSWNMLDNDTRLVELMTKLVELREPQILSGVLFDYELLNQTMGLRLMGQRFIPDSYILWQLVYANVGTRDEPRLMPKGLDVMAALGSDRAWDLLDDQKHYCNYVEQMERMWQFVENVADNEWTQNLYWLWLYSLLPLLVDPGEGYPFFMQSDAWVDKQLMTALASWTELRHDTILYAKQSYGGIESVPPTPLGYVEPVPRVYGRLASLCRMMQDGLNSRDILPSVLSEKLDLLEQVLLRLLEISLKELQGQMLSEGDLNFIHCIGCGLEYISDMPPEFNDFVSLADDEMAVVADVHTDLNTDTVLEEAVGRPMIIYVAVHVNGKTVLARGGTFSYYEFMQPINDRLTDEAWQEMLDNGEEPSMPSWTSSFVASQSSTLYQGLTAPSLMVIDQRRLNLL